MNTCGTCKYLTERQPVDYCPEGYYVCGLIEMRGNGFTPKPGEVAVVCDGSGYYAALCIKEEFGCNQWAARGAPQSPSVQSLTDVITAAVMELLLSKCEILSVTTPGLRAVIDHTIKTYGLPTGLNDAPK